MAMTPLKVFLFALGGSTAVGLTAYVSGALDPYFAERPVAIAALPEAGGDAPAAQAPATQPAAAEPEQAAPAAQAPAAEAPAEERPATDEQQSAEAPAAGAAPESPETEAPVGDQAALSPQPETPAGQQPETPAGQQPETPAGQQPGVPAAEPPAAAGETPATPPEAAPAAVQAPSFDLVRVEADGSLVIAGKAVPNARVEVLSGSNMIGASVADAGGEFVIVLDEPLKPGDYQLVLRATAPDGLVAMSTETAVISVPEIADGQVLALVEEPGQPSKLITVPEPEKPATDVAGAGAEAPAAGQQTPAAEAPAAAGEQPAAPGEGPAVAVAEPPPAEPPAAQPAAPSELMVAVEAVEIEGRKVFVAGMAKAGHSVRVYANEILLGETRASPDNRFLIEAEQELPVGDYIIRADLLAPDGSVVARAAVPFERQPGEAIAAVAPPAAPAEAPAAAPAQEPAPAAPPAADEVGQGTAPAAAPEPPAAGVAEAPAAAQPPAATEGSGQTGAEAIAQGEPAAPSTSGQASGETVQAPGAAPSVEQPAQPAPAGSSADVAAAPPADSDAEALAPKLQNVDGAVIIRRGDTLWQISRRVYGKGIRFSTIFLANQEQIRDPNRIWPGQVFRVPEKSQDGRDADLSRLGEQATTIEGEPAATE